MTLKGHNALWYAKRAVLWQNGRSWGISNGIIGKGAGDLPQAVNSNHVSICSGLATIINGKF